MSSAPPISAPITPEELAPHALRTIGALKDLPLQQQLAALQAAVAITTAAADLQTRLYMIGGLLNKR
jgi:hypothetical protein